VKGDGEDWLDYWYFPKGSLRAYGDTQSIVPQVKEIPAYIYNGQVFTAKDDLAGTVANDIITRFVNGKINETSIDRIIADFKGLKELCQKLK
jgi:hypothetical protein